MCHDHPVISNVIWDSTPAWLSLLLVTPRYGWLFGGTTSRLPVKKISLPPFETCDAVCLWRGFVREMRYFSFRLFPKSLRTRDTHQNLRYKKGSTSLRQNAARNHVLMALLLSLEFGNFLKTRLEVFPPHRTHWFRTPQQESN